MPKHVKRIECCYCGASALINLSNPKEMHLVCSGCGARMSVDKLAALTPDSAQSTPAPVAPVKREVRFERPKEDREQHRRRYHSDDCDDDDHRKSPKRRKRRSFIKRLSETVEDIWDEVEDIFD